MYRTSKTNIDGAMFEKKIVIRTSPSSISNFDIPSVYFFKGVRVYRGCISNKFLYSYIYTVKHDI